MKLFFRLSVPVFLVMAACLLFAPAAQAQRAADGPPMNDPFGRRVVPARAVPGGRYRSHSYDTQRGLLTIKATDGSTRQIQDSGTGVIKISYFAPGQQPFTDSSISVQPINALPGSDGVTAIATDGKTVRLLANPSSATANTVRLCTN